VPLGKRLLIEQDPREEVTKSGIIIPDEARERPCTGTVLRIGSRIKDPEVNAGDRIIYGKYTGTEVKIDKKTYVILKEDDVISSFTELDSE
jgi:chaperonin GroES